LQIGWITTPLRFVFSLFQYLLDLDRDERPHQSAFRVGCFLFFIALIGLFRYLMHTK